MDATTSALLKQLANNLESLKSLNSPFYTNAGFLGSLIASITALIWDCLNGQLLANIIGGFIATLLAFLFIENRLRRSINLNEKIRMTNNLLGDLEFNFWLANELIDKESEYLKSNRITYANYKTKAIEDFLYQRPIDKNDDVYRNVRILLNRILEVDNELLNNIRNGPGDAQENKKTVIK
ncbi:MAG: hypothetical protein M1365_07785, partial [Actinobacteria bacterium]|nr:hypothetical protein [Actinomycetota bacterium]